MLKSAHLIKKCRNCDHILDSRHGIKFCSNECQQDHQYKVFIAQWRAGLVTGGIGIRTKSISRHLRRYLLEKYNEKCSSCGWDKRHPITNSVPLEINHIDGDSENNSESNLRLICPNCHSMTINFRNLNRGNGRSWRLKSLTKV